MLPSIHSLPSGHTLTVTPTHGGVTVRRTDGAVSQNITVATAFGPYMVDREFLVSGGRASIVVAASDNLAAINAAVAVVTGIPTADQDDSSTIFNDAGVLKVSTAP
jgi:hypothetical protein